MFLKLNTHTEGGRHSLYATTPSTRQISDCPRHRRMIVHLVSTIASIVELMLLPQSAFSNIHCMMRLISAMQPCITQVLSLIPLPHPCSKLPATSNCEY